MHLLSQSDRVPPAVKILIFGIFAVKGLFPIRENNSRPTGLPATDPTWRYPPNESDLPLSSEPIPQAIVAPRVWRLSMRSVRCSFNKFPRARRKSASIVHRAPIIAVPDPSPRSHPRDAKGQKGVFTSSIHRHRVRFSRRTPRGDGYGEFTLHFRGVFLVKKPQL